MDNNLFADTFYKEVLLEADKNKNVECLRIHTKSGAIIKVDGTKRLSCVSIENNFINVFNDFDNQTGTETRYYIPFENIDFVELTVKEV